MNFDKLKARPAWNPIAQAQAIAYIELLNCYWTENPLGLEDVETWAESEEITCIESCEVYEWFAERAFDILLYKLSEAEREKLKVSVTERLQAERKLKDKVSFYG